MASAADSGVETGNDSNDSALQEKIFKMDLENSKQPKAPDFDKESSLLKEECHEILTIPHSSSEIVSIERSLSHLHPSTLMHGYEYHPKLPSSETCFALMNLTPNCTDLGGAMKPRLRRYSYMGMRRELRFNYLHSPAVSNYSRIHDTLRMCRAACQNNTEAMRQMLELGKSPNVHDGYRRTPLHLAACMGYADMVKLLLDHGADPNAKDSIGNTPLHLAACTNHIPVITLLLKAGTRITAGNSPLQLAITKFNIIKRSVMPHPVLKEQVAQVISMLTEYMRRKEGASLDADLINKFESLVRVSDSSEQVENNIRDLLSNLSSLDISSS